MPRTALSYWKRTLDQLKLIIELITDTPLTYDTAIFRLHTADLSISSTAERKRSWSRRNFGFRKHGYCHCSSSANVIDFCTDTDIWWRSWKSARRAVSHVHPRCKNASTDRGISLKFRFSGVNKVTQIREKWGPHISLISRMEVGKRCEAWFWIWLCTERISVWWLRVSGVAFTVVFQQIRNPSAGMKTETMATKD